MKGRGFKPRHEPPEWRLQCGLTTARSDRFKNQPPTANSMKRPIPSSGGYLHTGAWYIHTQKVTSPSHLPPTCVCVFTVYPCICKHILGQKQRLVLPSDTQGCHCTRTHTKWHTAPGRTAYLKPRFLRRSTLDLARSLCSLERASWVWPKAS